MKREADVGAYITCVEKIMDKRWEIRGSMQERIAIQSRTLFLASASWIAIKRWHSARLLVKNVWLKCTLSGSMSSNALRFNLVKLRKNENKLSGKVLCIIVRNDGISLK